MVKVICKDTKVNEYEVVEVYIALSFYDTSFLLQFIRII